VWINILRTIYQPLCCCCHCCQNL